MAVISTSFSSSFFTFPNSLLNSHSSSQSLTNSIKYYKKAPISASYATTADRTSTSTTTENETIKSFRNTCSSSLYEVLGVRIGADTREVKSAYRKLARVLHPDVASSDTSADEFMKIHAAYSTLSDPEKRAEYDRSLFQRPGRVSSPIRSNGGYKTRRWETDQCW